MKLFKLKYTGVVLFACLLFTNCKREKSYWDDDFIAPIAHGGLSLANLFPDTVIKSNTDSSLKISFEATLVNYGLDSMIKIRDTALTNSYIIGFTLPITPNYTLITGVPGETYYDLKGIQLKKASIRSGKVKVTLKNTCAQPLVYDYILNSASKNNIILHTSLTVNGNSTGIYYIDLAGYDIDFTGTNHNVFNTIEQTSQVSVAPNAQPDVIQPGQGITAIDSFLHIIPQYALGYFGSQSVAVGPDVASFNIFNNIKSGMLNLNSANMQIKIVNEFGIDMRASINTITSISTANQNTVTLNSSQLNAPLNINGAVNNGPNNPVTASSRTITLNNTNSNILNFIGNLPDKLGYKLTAQVNPNGNQSGGNDFGYYGTAFKAYLDADIPLYFSASNLVLADTVPLNFSSINQIKNINHGQLTLTAMNGYPFAINLQGYLLDENKMPIDLLFSNPNSIVAPALDANLKVIAPQQSKLYIPLTVDKINSLKRAKYIYYTATFNTTSQPNQVKFYNWYNLDILLTADINYSIGK